MPVRTPSAVRFARSSSLVSLAGRLAFPLSCFAMIELLAFSALAGDGVIELNQTCAVSTGCIAGDTPLFPITLNAGGSYRLTSNLTLPNQNTTGIQVNANDVTLDLNGFTLAGPATVSINDHLCTLPGSGVGIFGTGTASGLTVKNGHMRGMGASGIDVQAALVRLDSVVVERNCQDGARTGNSAIVLHSQARANGGHGFRLAGGSLVSGAISDNNGGSGIIAEAGSTVMQSIVTTNIGFGIDLSGLAVQNVARGNLQSGLAVSGGYMLDNMSQANGQNGIVGTASRSAANALRGNAGILAPDGPIVCNGLDDGSVSCPP